MYIQHVCLEQLSLKHEIHKRTACELMNE